MKIFKYIFLLMLPLAALAQFTPPAADRVTVTTDGDGLLVGPSTFWTANAGAIAGVVEGEDIDVDWSQITGTPTTLGGYGITDAVNVSAIGTAEGDLVTLSAGGVWADALISVSSVTQHEGALTLANTQVTGLGDLAILNTVDTGQIDDEAVTLAKIQDITTGRLLGRTTAEAGVVEQLTASDVRTFLNLPDDVASEFWVKSQFGQLSMDVTMPESVDGIYSQYDVIDGRPAYERDGIIIFWVDSESQWRMNVDGTTILRINFDDVPTPDLITSGWLEIEGAAGPVTIDAVPELAVKQIGRDLLDAENSSEVVSLLGLADVATTGDAADLTGDLDDARLSSNVALLDRIDQTWTERNVFVGSMTLDGGVLQLEEAFIRFIDSSNFELNIQMDGVGVDDWTLKIPEESARGTANIATREWVESDATISEGQITGLGELATMDSVSNANLDFAVVPATEAVMLSDGGGGMGHEHVNGVYLRDGELNGKPRYVKGDQEIVWRQLDTDPIGWHVKDINDSIWYFWSTQDVATPDLVTNWLTGDSFPVATVSLLSYTPATQEWVDEKIDARFSSLNTAAVDASGVLAMPDLNTGNTVLVDEVADSGEEPTGNVVLSGAGESQVNGVYLPNGEVNGRPSWKLDGSGDPGMRLLATSGSLWVWQIIDPTHEVLYGTWDQEVENPWDAIGWQDEEGDLPAPTVEQETAPAPGDTLTSITGMVTGAQYMLVNATGAALTLEASANLVLARGDPDLTLAEDEAVIVISLSPTKATIP